MASSAQKEDTVRVADMAAGSTRHGQVGRRPATTKDRISAVGIELFTEQGFDETSIEQIAEAAGIARRTFFRYFPSKNALPWG
ncbi:MAG: TetR family transcriptional regulator, partial [Aldersonia sp.]|nr:TetR family transcriptional regulator [Aldersonia sp.]